MSKELKITKERIKKLVAGLSSCPEAREAVEDAFPEVFEEKEEWADVTEETTWKIGRVASDYWLEGSHGDKVIFLTAEGTKIDLNNKTDEGNYKIEETPTGAFRILKRK